MAEAALLVGARRWCGGGGNTGKKWDGGEYDTMEHKIRNIHQGRNNVCVQFYL